VQGHLAKIYGKLEANSRTEAVMKAVSLGVITAEFGGNSDR
jgi:DNA-binding CsgD family transcriptional regulator